MGKKASRPWYFLRTSLNIRLSQNIHRCSHLDLQKLFPPLSLATGLAAGQRHISLEQMEKQREEQRTVRVLRHLSSMPCPPPRTQLQCHQNQDEVTAAATNQQFAFTGESHVAKLWGPYAAVKGIYGFSLPALHRNTDDSLKTKLPTWGKNKKKAQLVTERRDIYLAHWPPSYFLLTGRRHFNFTAYKKLPIRKLRFSSAFLLHFPKLCHQSRAYSYGNTVRRYNK